MNELTFGKPLDLYSEPSSFCIQGLPLWLRSLSFFSWLN